MRSGQHPTRERLISVVVALLDDLPPEDIQVSLILERSLVTKGSLYHFFEDLSDLVEEALLRRFAAQAQETISALKSALARAGNAADFHAQLGRVVAHAQSDPASRFERARVLAMAHTRARFRDKLASLQSHLTDALAECLAEAQDRGLLNREFLPRTGAVFLQTYALGRVVDDLPGGQLADEDWQRFFRMIAQRALG